MARGAGLPIRAGCGGPGQLRVSGLPSIEMLPTDRPSAASCPGPRRPRATPAGGVVSCGAGCVRTSGVLPEPPAVSPFSCWSLGVFISLLRCVPFECSGVLVWGEYSGAFGVGRDGMADVSREVLADSGWLRCLGDGF